uniref:Uncharacterized protein n=1 Tax=Strigamia maritima TaxID=126957 RepID=T1JA83_STRMM
ALLTPSLGNSSKQWFLPGLPLAEGDLEERVTSVSRDFSASYFEICVVMKAKKASSKDPTACLRWHLSNSSMDSIGRRRGREMARIRRQRSQEWRDRDYSSSDNEDHSREYDPHRYVDERILRYENDVKAGLDVREYLQPQGTCTLSLLSEALEHFSSFTIMGIDHLVHFKKDKCLFRDKLGT